ncbi:hypothetical protein [Alsobacter metallidurans]|uniref:hypothetical protein n=1 Tax=Alsobacter metallidurans TaxID=340221 RepID=UPI0027E50250|nr:hypothetical protein [Alsobacter metallidurans]
MLLNDILLDARAISRIECAAHDRASNATHGRPDWTANDRTTHCARRRTSCDAAVLGQSGARNNKGAKRRCGQNGFHDFLPLHTDVLEAECPDAFFVALTL